MRQLYINPYEKVVSQDLDNLQLAIQKGFSDDFLYNYLGNSNGVLGSSLLGSYVSALASSIAAGVGFFYDAAQTGYNPKYRMIYAASAIPATHTAAHATLNRIDRVCLAPNFAVTALADRYIKTGGTGPIVLSSVDKDKADSYTLAVVAGTPGASPSAPATPAGYISLYTAYIHAVTGMASGSDITDTRTVLTFAVSNSGHLYLTSATLQGQLDNADTSILYGLGARGRITVAATPFTVVAATHDGAILEVDNTSLAIQVNLPNPATLVNSKPFKLTLKDYAFKFAVNNLTIHRFGSEKIEGVAADYVASTLGWCRSLYSDGTDWRFIQ